MRRARPAECADVCGSAALIKRCLWQSSRSDLCVSHLAGSCRERAGGQESLAEGRRAEWPARRIGAAGEEPTGKSQQAISLLQHTTSPPHHRYAVSVQLQKYSLGDNFSPLPLLFVSKPQSGWRLLRKQSVESIVPHFIFSLFSLLVSTSPCLPFRVCVSQPALPRIPPRAPRQQSLLLHFV